MPRPTKAKAVKPTANSFVSSAARVTSKRTKGVPKQQGVADWQAEVWRMLDTVGEVEFYRSWKANAMQRVSLYVSYEQDDGSKVRVTAENAAEYPLGQLAVGALEELFGGETGQSQMMEAMGSHITLPGETWLVGLVNPKNDIDAPDQWRVLARDEITQQGSKWVIDRGDGVVESYEDGSKDGVDAEALVIRIWRSHPRKWVEAHSSCRSALPILRELEGLTAHVGATIDSRLAGAGVLFVPQELTFATPTPGEPAEQQGQQNDVDAFMAALTDAMIASRTDRGDARSVAPIIAKVPAQYLDKIKHVTFWSEFNAEARETRMETINRLANALDIPAEVLTGMADVNHWTGWLLDENAIKMHVEPPVEVITHGLTTRYLWPAIVGDAETVNPAVRRWSLEGDTSALRQRPNRTAEAQELHNRMVITDKALAREVGFEASDLLADPDNALELKRRLLMAAASGVTTADVTVAAMAELGVSITPKPSEVEPDPAATPAALPPGGTTPADGPENRDPRQPPAPSQAQMTALLVAGEAAVLRAVERAWNRAGKRRGDRAPVEAAQLDDCLRDAWGWTDRSAALCGVDPQRLRTTLDTYTRSLLVTGAEYDPIALARTLAANVLSPPPEAIGG